MNKIIRGIAIIVILSLSINTAFALGNVRYALGDNVTTANLNIRSQPRVGNNRIDHFLQGMSVHVEAIMGNWCRVRYKKYRRAYVYCPYLENKNTALPELNTPPKAVPEPLHGSAPVEKSLTPQGTLMGVQRWLNSDDGSFYISDSYWNARKKAKVWNQNAELASFSFEYSQRPESYCSMIFASKDKSHTVFKAWCFSKSTDTIDTVELQKTKTYAPFDLPALLLPQFISGILNEKSTLREVNNYFTGSANVKLTFSLTKAADAPPQWTARFSDGTKFFLISADADKTAVHLTTQKG